MKTGTQPSTRDTANDSRPSAGNLYAALGPKPNSVPLAEPSGNADGSEELNLNNVVEGYELRKAADETQKELRELFESAIGAELDVDMSLAEVDGFARGIKLLPHQVQSRVWMTERETGKKCGGILGDVSQAIHRFNRSLTTYMLQDVSNILRCYIILSVLMPAIPRWVWGKHTKQSVELSIARKPPIL
jgi:hypothetical protein